MAIPDLGTSGEKHLFGRLPSRLFAPLAAPNRQQHWTLLCALYERESFMKLKVAMELRWVEKVICETTSAQVSRSAVILVRSHCGYSMGCP